MVRTKNGKTFTRKQWSKVKKGEFVCLNKLNALVALERLEPPADLGVFLGIKDNCAVVYDLQLNQKKLRCLDDFIPLIFYERRVKKLKKIK